MEFFIEVILDLIFEGSIEIIKSNTKISKWIRYPLIVLIILFFMVITFGLFILGIFVLNKNIYAGLLFIVTSLILLILGIIEFRKQYIITKQKKKINK